MGGVVDTGPTPPLTGGQKRYLRGLAHGFKPVVWIGKAGLTDGVLANLDQALEAHELIKVKLSDSKELRREISAQIDTRLGTVQVGAIGHVAIFYRPASDPEMRSIELPGRARA